MGKSAKVHKRIQRKQKPSTATSPAAAAAGTSSHVQQAQAAKKRSRMKEKASSTKSRSEKVLGGADYVSLLMGSRRKAKEEALKLPEADR